MKYLFSIVFLLSANLLYSQNFSFGGYVFDESGKPISYSTAVLLNPNDSTLEYYGISNKEGRFNIKNIKKGDYLLQIAFVGYETVYKNISFPNSEIGKEKYFILKQTDENIDEVTVNGEYTPISIKKDTIEYNADAFKTKPDAVVEDLLKKLPCVKVDRAGNIKAMGEDVNKLLVDGKEFFGNDPKTASKNLPADAVDKIQVYDQRSDESDFTGIDDGVRDKTINLQLKDDRKNSFFGDISGGYGTDDHYKASAKAYKFNNKNQFALLGMINNINQFGFSFNDYLNFNGGVASMMSGSGSAKIEISDDNSFPVNFGQPVTGLFTSGAGGLNYSYSKSKHDRIFMSYLGNGTDKFLEQQTRSEYFTTERSYDQTDSLKENKYNEAHRVNFGYRKRIDSSQNIIFNSAFNLIKNDRTGENLHSAFESDIPINTQELLTNNQSQSLSGNMNGSYIKKFGNKRTIFKLNLDAFLQKEINTIDYDGKTEFFETDLISNVNKFQNNNTDILNCTGTISFMQKTNTRFYLVPAIQYGNKTEQLKRIEGSLQDEMNITENDIEFRKRYEKIDPHLSFKRNTDKSKLSLKAGFELSRLTTSLHPETENQTDFFFFTPSFSYEYEYKAGRRINFSYYSNVQTPTVNQLLPVQSTLNELSVFRGNIDLKPEYAHTMNAYWWIFDQFSFTSVMTNIQAGYTRNKINWATSVNEQLEQTNTLVNTDDDKYIRGNIDFSTQVRKLGIQVNLDLEETYNEGINLVNDIENIVRSDESKLSLSLENRKKDKIDLIGGFGINFSDARYSVQNELNKKYRDIYCFGEMHYTPHEKLDFGITADVTKYTDQSFNESVLIPLLNAEINFRFLKHNRAQFSLNAFDLLNQNTGVRRISELNYLKETRSNTIGRYVMLSLKFRFNKYETNDGLDIEINGRR